MGGVLFIDEAYYLYRQENERDYGQESIEILLQVMENNRDDLVVILAGYADKMDLFFRSNPGFRSRVAHHIDFPDYTDGDLLAIGEKMLATLNYSLSRRRAGALAEYIPARRAQPPVRQRPLDPQRARPGAPQAGEPALRRGRSGAHARAPDHDRGAGHPGEPGVRGGEAGGVGFREASRAGPRSLGLRLRRRVGASRANEPPNSTPNSDLSGACGAFSNPAGVTASGGRA